jgi:hypothetical protein
VVHFRNRFFLGTRACRVVLVIIPTLIITKMTGLRLIIVILDDLLSPGPGRPGWATTPVYPAREAIAILGGKLENLGQM